MRGDMSDRDKVIELLDVWLKDFRAAAVLRFDNGGDPTDMFNLGSMVANSKATRRARERQQSRAIVDPTRGVFQ
jgi:hypothetical protein